MLTVYFSHTASLDGAVYATAVHDFNSERFLKDNYRAVMLQEQHQCCSLHKLKDEEIVSWIAIFLRMRYIIWLVVKSISPARATKLSKIANISTATLRIGTPLHTLCQVRCATL